MIHDVVQMVQTYYCIDQSRIVIEKGVQLLDILQHINCDHDN